MKKLIVVDGNSVMFRAYFATAAMGNLMQTRSGLYTNAVYGFVNMMKRLLTDSDITHVFVAFDKGKKTFRHQSYSEYKGTRNKTPEEFLMQIPFIKEYLDILKIKHFEMDNYEADDLVGTVSHLGKDFDEVEIYSGDHDLLQLVGDNRVVCLNKVGITNVDVYTKDNFKEKMGFEPNQLIDYKGLLGDSSDNLPGVTGIGPKTAIKLLDQYQTLENLLEHTSELKGMQKVHVEEDQDKARMSKYLATIITNVDVPFTIDDCLYQHVPESSLIDFYEKMEFKSFLSRLEKSRLEKSRLEKSRVNDVPSTKVTSNTIKQTPVQTSLFDTVSFEKENKNDCEVLNQTKIIRTKKPHDIELCFDEIQKEKKFSIDCELTQANYHQASLLGFAIATKKYSFFLTKEEFFSKDFLSFFKSDVDIICYDTKKLFVTLFYLGKTINYTTFDITLADYVLNPAYGCEDASYLFKRLLGEELPLQETIYGKKDIFTIPEVTIYENYAMDKVSGAYDLYPIMTSELQKVNALSLLKDMEIPLAFTLGKMESAGFKVNPQRLDEIGETLQSEMSRLEQLIYQAAGEKFNISSPKQLGEILFEKLELAKGKKNKTGYVTSADVLEKLATKHVVPRYVLEYRKYSKLNSTYIQGLKLVLNPVDSKVHTIFKQNLTLTGRLSSIEPNIQNIPVRTSDGRLIRSAFVPSTKDGVLISSDYSQIELRILAHVSQCKNMIDDFNSGVDFHASTAAKIYGVPLDQVTKEMRRMAKAVNFGIIYGMGTWSLSEEIHVSPEEASAFISKYFAIYPEVKSFLDETVENAKIDGYTSTIYHRRRYIPEIVSSNHFLQKFGERTAMNAPIQGSAADIIKLAMIEVDRELEQRKLSAKMVAQVHDELIIDTPQNEIEVVKEVLTSAMTKVIKMSVPLTIDIEQGSTWDLK
jgi:DNA polymerase-1